MAMGVVRLVGGEVAGVDLTPVAVRALSRGRARPLEELDDARVRCGEPPRELHRVALVVPPLFCDRVLVVRRHGRPVLVDAALDAVGEDLGRIRDVADDLQRRPLVELGGAQAVRRYGADDPRDRRGVVGEPESFVLVVAELFQVLLLSRM